MAVGSESDRPACRALRQAAGRRRARWVAVAVASVQLVVAVVLAGCGPDPARISPPQAVAHEGSSLGAALLQPNELGAGWLESAVPPGAPPWPWLQADCPTYRNQDYPAQAHRRDAVQRRYQYEASALTASHIVEAYEPGWALRALEDTRRVLRSCAEYAAWGGRVSFTIVESGFLADDALLVRGRIERPGYGPTVAYFVTVRRGEVISTLNLPDSGDEIGVRAVATKLVDRLG
jgi:hypothetical protein